MAAAQRRLFGTNGVRFVPGVSHDLDFAINLGEAIGTYFGDGELLVGQDGRVSSPALANAAISGLMSSGRDVAEAGLVPTPALQYAVKMMGFKGGVMVTASHNPAQYNGLKVAGSDGVEVPRLDEQRIEKIFFDRSQTKADWKTVGVARLEPSVVRSYITGILSKVNSKLVTGRKFTVVMDAGNGAQCVAAPYLVEALGCKLITLNSVVDGAFPGRGPEPTPEMLKDLSAVVKSVGADLGVAYDGDGDRSIFCDEEGRILWGDQTGCLIADYVLEQGWPACRERSALKGKRWETTPAGVRRTPICGIERHLPTLRRISYKGMNTTGWFETLSGCYDLKRPATNPFSRAATASAQPSSPSLHFVTP